MGLDLRRVDDASHLEALCRALADHLVVFLPEQDITLDDLERVTDLLGGRDATPFVEPLEDRPYVIRVIKEPTDVVNFANAWHSDLSYLSAPPSYTLLHAWEVPDHGGDTVWSNQYLAYERLSEGLRATLDRLDAVHSAGMAYGTGGAARPGEGLDVHGDRPLARGLRRAGAPGGDGAPRHREASTVRESGLHVPFRGVDQGGVGGAPGAAASPQQQRELHLPLAVVAPHAGHLGQPVHDAQRTERLLGCAPRDVPHQRQGRRSARHRLTGGHAAFVSRGRERNPPAAAAPQNGRERGGYEVGCGADRDEAMSARCASSRAYPASSSFSPSAFGKKKWTTIAPRSTAMTPEE